MFLMKTARILSAAALCAAPFLFVPVASAHVVLEYQVAEAAKSYKATFKVGHGCGASPTRQIVVLIPAGVRGAKPMPKAGWSIEITREKLAAPYSDHGRQVTEDVTRVTWTARTPDDYLPNEQYDEFVLNARMPDQAGTLYWPVQQLCAQGRNDWTDVPRAGQKLGDLKSPAAVLEVLPGAGGGHAH